MTAVEEYESALFARLLDGLAALDRVTLHGRAARRAPTAFFSVAGVAPRAVAEHLAARGVNVWDGDNYAYELCTVLGLEPDGAVRAGLVHYNDASDVDRFLEGIAALAKCPKSKARGIQRQHAAIRLSAYPDFMKAVYEVDGK